MNTNRRRSQAAVDRRTCCLLCVAVLAVWGLSFLLRPADMRLPASIVQRHKKARFVEAVLFNRTHDAAYHAARQDRTYFDRGKCLAFLRLYSSKLPLFMESTHKAILDTWPDLDQAHDADLNHLCYWTAYKFPGELFGAHLVFGTRISEWAGTVQTWLETTGGPDLALPVSKRIRTDMLQWKLFDDQFTHATMYDRLAHHKRVLGDWVYQEG